MVSTARQRGFHAGNDPRVYDTSRDVDTIDTELEDPDLDCTNDGKAPLIIQEGPDEPDRLPDV
jgi:hypothetical protein